MKRESKILSLVIVAIVLVAVLSFTLSTLMTNGIGTRLQGAAHGANRIPSTEETTVYKDWTESTPIENDYSYSTLIYTDKTEFFVNINDENHEFGLGQSDSYYRVQDKVTPYVKIWFMDDIAQLIITNCGYDKDGNSLSAVLELSVNSTYRKDDALDPFEYNPETGNMKYYVLDENGNHKKDDHGNDIINEASELTSLSLSKVAIQNVTDDGKVVLTGKATEPNLPASSNYLVTYNMPLAFNLGVNGSAVDVKITYYKKLTLKGNRIVNGANFAEVDTANSKIATSITKINSAYNDFDTTPYSFSYPENVINGYAEAGMYFEGNEGMKPLVGKSTLFYNKTGKQTLTPSDYENTFIPQNNKATYNFRMTEKANGIFINPDYSQESVLHGKWDSLIRRLMAKGKTRKQALDHYCKYVAKCTVEYDDSVNWIDDDSGTVPPAAKEQAQELFENVCKTSEGYYDTAGFSYLTSAQLLTSGVEGQFAFRYEMPSGGIKFGFLSPQGYQFGNPKKSVSQDTIGIGEVGYFNVTQDIPNNNVTNSVGFNKVYPNVFSSNYRITSYKIEDEVDKRLSVVKEGIKIMTSRGTDITSYFNITVDENNKVTAVSKENAAFFTKLEAYGTKYTMTIPFMYLGAVDKYIEIPNKAKVTYKVGTSNPETKETNEVVITIGEKPVKLTYDCTTNGGAAEFDPTTVQVVPGKEVDLSKVCVREGYRFLGWTEKATDTTAMTAFTMPDKDTTIYGIYTTSTCDTVLLSSVYKIDQTNYIINIPYDETDTTIISNVNSKGEISISGDKITVKCDGTTRDYTISRYWVAKTGNDVIRWTAIIAGTLLLGVVLLIVKIKMNKKEN